MELKSYHCEERFQHDDKAAGHSHAESPKQLSSRDNTASPHLC